MEDIRGRFLAAFAMTAIAFAYPLLMWFWLDATWDPFTDEPTPTCGTCGLASLAGFVTATWAIVLAWRSPTTRFLRLGFTMFTILCWIVYGMGGLLLAVGGPGIVILSMGLGLMNVGPGFLFFGWLLHRRWQVSPRTFLPNDGDGGRRTDAQFDEFEFVRPR